MRNFMKAAARPEQQAPYEPVRQASLARRLGAMLYDTVAVAALWFGVTAILLLTVTGGDAIPPGNPWYALFLAAVGVLYFIGSWRGGGQTLGMRAWKLRLVSDAGNAPGFCRLSARVGIAALSLACFGIGFLWALARPDRRTWHDLATKTHLVQLG